MCLSVIYEIVELASLDSHRCSLEKLNCLATTYNLIFAELKTAIIEVIANSTDANEHDIPIVNNSDIKPVLLGAIVKAKLKHLCTNLYYMQVFGSIFSQQFKAKMNWKDTVATVTGKVFPGLSNNIHEKIVENEVMSNLPLQMSLYFNVIFLPIWLIILAVLLYDKFETYGEFTKFVMITILISIFIIEMIRLYLGYEGNLRDKVPELAGFWMLSILLQLPLQGFLLLNPFFKLRPLEKVVQAVMYALLIVQLMSGYCALKYTSKKQATYFRIMKLRTEGERNRFRLG